VSTRKLIIAALICGLAILVAGAFQFVQIANQHSNGSQAPTASTTVSGR
jgi:hypothetical protein